MKTYRELRPIGMPHDIFDEVEKIIREVLKREIYVPLLKHTQEKKIALNAEPTDLDALRHALFKGTITYNRGRFSGHFDAHTSRTLKKLGAKWVRKDSTFALGVEDVPDELIRAVRSSESQFKEKIADIQQQLTGISSESIASKVNLMDSFKKVLKRSDGDFRKYATGLTLAPELSQGERDKIAKDWESNMQLSIKGHVDEEVIRLRERVRKTVFAGDRYGTLVKSIQKSFSVSASKAKFLARQETSLLTAKYQEARYVESGINEYRWKDVGGTPAHPVRPRHHELSEMSRNGKIFRFDNPPRTTEPGQPKRFNNPHQDYGCRCTAIPVVRFGESK